MNEKIIFKGGIVSLLDSNNNIVSYKVYDSKTHRQKIIHYWERLYKLDNKTYYIVISPKQN